MAWCDFMGWVGTCVYVLNVCAPICLKHGRGMWFELTFYSVHVLLYCVEIETVLSFLGNKDELSQNVNHKLKLSHF